jgi:hypothetical protein
MITAAITDLVMDSRRGYLYTLHSNSHITYYSLGIDGKSLQQLGVYRDVVEDLTRAYTQSQDIGPVPPGNDWKTSPIVSIAVVEVEESRHIQLVAVTNTGKLYRTFTQQLLTTIRCADVLVPRSLRFEL